MVVVDVIAVDVVVVVKVPPPGLTQQLLHLPVPAVPEHLIVSFCHTSWFLTYFQN